MAEFNFFDSIMDKVLVGSIAGVLSMFVLHGYNVHAKAFEGAQTQLRSVSAIHTDAKKEIVVSVGKVRSTVGRSLISPSRPSDSADVLRNIDNVRSSAATIKVRMPKSEKLASGIADYLYETYYKATAILRSEGEFTKSEAAIASKQIAFVNQFDSELVEILSEEFNRAYDQYYGLTAWWARPMPLALAALAFSVLIMFGYKLAGRY